MSPCGGGLIRRKEVLFALGQQSRGASQVFASVVWSGRIVDSSPIPYQTGGDRCQNIS